MKKRSLIGIFLCLALVAVSIFIAAAFSASAEAYRLGDVDKNGYVQLRDATLIQKYKAVLVTLDDSQKALADVDGNKSVELRDATYIQKFLARLIDSFPGEATTEPTTKETSPQPTTQPASDIQLILNVEIPKALPDGASLTIGSTLNSWQPSNLEWAATKIDDTHYTLTKTLPASQLGTTIQYKWTVQIPGETNQWAKVEGNETGGEISNRSFKLESAVNTQNDVVVLFKDLSGQSTVTGGTLEIHNLTMTQYSDNRTRKIRVWLPEGYDPENTEKTYPVLYMHDGQNLFDTFTGFSGEWCVDESIKAMMDQGYQGSIVVGIDNGPDRLNELCATWPLSSTQTNITDASCDKYAAFIVDTVKPFVDENYNTKSDRANTGIGGSSMGGNASLYMALEYPDVFGYSLCFSTALQFFTDAQLQESISGYDFATSPSTLPKIFLYCGGAGGEGGIAKYVDLVSNALKDAGYPEAKINTLIDATKGHNEAAWAEYFPPVYCWSVDWWIPPVD